MIKMTKCIHHFEAAWLDYIKTLPAMSDAQAQEARSHFFAGGAKCFSFLIETRSALGPAALDVYKDLQSEFADFVHALIDQRAAH